MFLLRDAIGSVGQGVQPLSSSTNSATDISKMTFSDIFKMARNNTSLSAADLEGVKARFEALKIPDTDPRKSKITEYLSAQALTASNVVAAPTTPSTPFETLKTKGVSADVIALLEKGYKDLTTPADKTRFEQNLAEIAKKPDAAALLSVGKTPAQAAGVILCMDFDAISNADKTTDDIIVDAKNKYVSQNILNAEPLTKADFEEAFRFLGLSDQLLNDPKELAKTLFDIRSIGVSSKDTPALEKRCQEDAAKYIADLSSGKEISAETASALMTVKTYSFGVSQGLSRPEITKLMENESVFIQDALRTGKIRNTRVASVFLENLQQVIVTLKAPTNVNTEKDVPVDIYADINMKTPTTTIERSAADEDRISDPIGKLKINEIQSARAELHEGKVERFLELVSKAQIEKLSLNGFNLKDMMDMLPV